MTHSSSSGASGLNLLRGGCCDDRIELSMLLVVGPSKGRRPAHISYATTPRLKMSLRSSTISPRICSGERYALALGAHHISAVPPVDGTPGSVSPMKLSSSRLVR